MEKQDFIIQFLLKETIPPVTRQKDQPQGMKQDRIWDAIKKAHKDVVTGARTKNIDTYCKANCDEENKTLIALYEKIRESSESKTSLCSEDLIDYLCNEDASIEFGAIQKLVNMTLKYLMILKFFNKDLPIEIDDKRCDCPIDRMILAKLGPHTPWTQMEKTEYDQVQAEIRAKLQSAPEAQDLGNIWFDFMNWKVEERDK